MKVTIVIPMFNAEGTISRAIQSCLAQTHRPIEVIVVDDHSTDRSHSLAVSHRENTPKSIELTVVSNPRKGAPSARNHGLELSKGKFIQFLDADDEIDALKIEKQVEQLRKTKADVSISKFITKDTDSEIPPPYGVLPEGHRLSVDWLLRHVVQTHAPLHRKTALELINGWDESLSAAQDWDLHLRMALANVKFVTIQQSLAITHIQPDSISSNLDRVYAGAFSSLKNNWSDLKYRLMPGGIGFKQILFIALHASRTGRVESTAISNLLRDIPLSEKWDSPMWWKFIWSRAQLKITSALSSAE